MPGPKMGPRPHDFNESTIKQSPTYVKWCTLNDGEVLRYACREFMKGHEQDEERLMRRIMIARRNNIRDHETLKVARQRCNVVGVGGGSNTILIPSSVGSNQLSSDRKSTITSTNDKNVSILAANEHTNASTDPNTKTTSSLLSKVEELEMNNVQQTQQPVLATNNTTAAVAPVVRTRRPPHTFSDSQVEQEMDVLAVEKTRSYKSWLLLPDGSEFLYNQKYIKGREGHDWLLRKNIWRRMRYRRENKQLVLQHKQQQSQGGIGTNQNVSLQHPRQNISTLSVTTTTGPTSMTTLSTTTTVKAETTENQSRSSLNTETDTDRHHVDMDVTISAAADVGRPISSSQQPDNVVTATATTDNDNDAVTAAAAVAAVTTAAVAATSQFVDTITDDAAIEAAVAAAESHFQSQQQQIDQELNNIINIDGASKSTDNDEAIAQAVAAAAAVVAVEVLMVQEHNLVQSHPTDETTKES